MWGSLRRILWGKDFLTAEKRKEAGVLEYEPKYYV